MSQLSGMTGFARVSGDAEWGQWAWEAKSVNGRGLDVRVGTPPGFDALEREVKREAGGRFKRGSVQVSLRIEPAGGRDALSVNMDAVMALEEAWRERTGLPMVEPGALATLMTARGVLDARGTGLRDLADDEDVVAVLKTGMLTALDGLAEARTHEGTALAGILNGLVDEMEALAGDAAGIAAGHPALVKARFEAQLEELGAADKVDAERLATEVAISAAKADVREELDRLTAHFATAREHVEAGSPIGRKLDFLAQELNREANTLCSKSISLDLTNAGLGLKGLIDQFKEQAANVE